MSELSDEHKEAIRQVQTGRVHSVETRARNSAAKKGVLKSDAWRQARSEAMRGKPRDEVTRKKMSAALAKIWRFLSPEGECREIVNLRAFCRDNGLNTAAMHRVAHGKSKVV